MRDFLISADMMNGCILTFTELFNHYFALGKPRTEYILLQGIGRCSLKPQGVEFQIVRQIYLSFGRFQMPTSCEWFQNGNLATGLGP